MANSTPDADTDFNTDSHGYRDGRGNSDGHRYLYAYANTDVHSDAVGNAWAV